MELTTHDGKLTAYAVGLLHDHAEAGARFLDEHDHGWADAIDLDRLKLEDGCGCILGQRYGSFDDGCRRLGLDPLYDSRPLSAARHGFVLEDDLYLFLLEDPDDAYKVLDEAWREQIVARRAAA